MAKWRGFGGVVGAVLVILQLLTGVALAVPDQPIYKPQYEYPVLEELRKEREAQQAIEDSLQELVDERYKKEEQLKKKEEMSLRLDWSLIDKPSGPEAFPSAFHFPPVPQYASGTCWAFCSVSFFETEIQRLTGQEIKLSEMWVVYWEFVEKVRHYVQNYGHSNFSVGSQDQATREIFRTYGAVPAEVYKGATSKDGRHDHSQLGQELRSYLAWVEENGFWDEKKVISYTRTILDKYLGEPPVTFTYIEKTYTPKSFAADVLKLSLDDYICLVSTSKKPFGKFILHDVFDNWRRSEDYLNLPLDDYYQIIRSAIIDGYTVSLGVDVSEPGMDGFEDAAVIPSWDIPSEFINQGSREFRIDNETTTDDHGVHVVGYLNHNGQDWYLIKDSNRSSRLGKFKGYYFYHGDYIKLKTLSLMIHKDRLEKILKD
ncbi:MAG: C1 family peptidase [Candidatus Eisenbacteria bacterium]|uniref:C1 family peptidase n=1 Tax=Eiseniibacteriota bacterium TaxID=2212470 RepID=A0A948RWF4_UNCEI|nr:C1 family peptidase [Candidatus Eisenbacteria bacterium]MBU1949952.1 C1 family peptidase [Candidatus Eisenbacteria bacterium]MBU2690899.1 C1 family peptidase [Candidatus Eisenbacteria bacterium]